MRRAAATRMAETGVAQGHERPVQIRVRNRHDLACHGQHTRISDRSRGEVRDADGTFDRRDGEQVRKAELGVNHRPWSPSLFEGPAHQIVIVTHERRDHIYLLVTELVGFHDLDNSVDVTVRGADRGPAR